MFGLNSVKKLIKKWLNLAKIFQAIDLERMSEMVNHLDKYKRKLQYLQFVLLILLILTMVNTVLITIILLKH